MDSTIYCLVDAMGKVYITDAAESYADVALAFDLDEHACQRYRFDLASRRLLRDRGSAVGDQLTRAYLEQWIGTPEKLVKLAEQGRLPKHVLMNLLVAEDRQAYLEACGVIEKRYTDECAAAKDPCLEPGCAVEGEICLQPLLRAGSDYHRACAAEWITRFANPRHRVEAWKN